MTTSTDGILLYGIPLAENAIHSKGGFDGEPSPYQLAYGGDNFDGISIVTHCSDRCPLHFVAIANTCITATRGSPEPINPSQLTVPEGSDQKLIEYIKRHELEVEGNPGWYLASYWG